MRRRWKILIGLGIALVVAAATTWLWLPLVAGLAEPMIRTQVLAIARDLLKPRVEIGHLEYHYPLGLDIIDLRVVSTDEAGTESTILDAPRVTIVLDRLPVVGPLVFRDFELTDTSVRVDVAEDGTVVGWGDLLTGGSTAGRDARPVSEIFAIDRIQVSNLSVEYSMVGDDRSMVLDQLDFEIDNKGRQGDRQIDLGKGPGWYEIDTTLKRDELFDIAIDGGVDIDTLDVRLKKLDLDVVLDQDSVSHLPPQVQGFITEHDVEGRLDASFSGNFNLEDPRRDDTRFKIGLQPTHFAFGDQLIEIDAASMEGKYESEVLVLSPCTIDLFGGKVDLTLKMADETTRGLPEAPEGDGAASGEGSTTARSQARIEAVREASGRLLPDAAVDSALAAASGVHAFATVEVSDVQISKIHRVGSDEPNKMAGLVDATVEFDLNLGRPLATFGGGGEASITQGRFTGGATVKALAGLMEIVTLSPGRKDEARMSFILRDEQVELTRLAVLAGPIGARGTGTIGFDGALDLRLNAGPLERLQATTGKVGELLGLLTDGLAKYVVRGTIEDPKVSIAPLGIDFSGG